MPSAIIIGEETIVLRSDKRDEGTCPVCTRLLNGSIKIKNKRLIFSTIITLLCCDGVYAQPVLLTVYKCSVFYSVPEVYNNIIIIKGKNFKHITENNTIEKDGRATRD